ncbi:hypothetical protein MNBD_ALPHA08-1351 [hydrothermal vent metagenome]|uniref:Membrane fusion protein biotin-lipoyl like domain-containing protein n=1 Tax=hydrothermal vent metagenome TaxID=652676 RepID=A0A3B0SKP2_9ZZZZ
MQKIKVDKEPSNDNQNQRLQALLLLEAELRRQPTQMALSLWAVNEVRAVVDYSQCFLLRMNRVGKARVTAVSSLANVDRNAPFVRWIEQQVSKVSKERAKSDGDAQAQIIEISLAGNTSKHNNEVYPFQQTVFLPFYDRSGRMFGGLLMARSKAWQEAEQVIAVRLAETVSHAFQALTSQKRLRVWSMPKWLGLGVAGLVALAMFIPVPMTTLAPAEIIADEPVIVVAPIDGVVARIFPDANVAVKRGDLLFEFDNTELKAGADIARRTELVSQARLATARQAAFSDPQVYRQLAIAKAEVELARAEKIFSENKLARTIVRAQKSGQLIYTDRKDWIGKPVRTGERVMEIADVKRVVLRIDLPVAEAINLRNGADVRLFLDANPLKALSAKLRHASYFAVEQPGVGLVYRVVADLEVGGERKIVPRIGLRGTAQIFGEQVFLGFYLFRKPISSVRQYFGF